MLKNERHLANVSEVVKMYICYGFRAWMWQNGSIAPPIE